jgi:hypothetical protein
VIEPDPQPVTRVRESDRWAGAVHWSHPEQ